MEKMRNQAEEMKEAKEEKFKSIGDYDIGGSAEKQRKSLKF